MLLSENAKALFAERQDKILHLIETSGIEYEEIGIFGSYARGDCKTTSDIDFLVIVKEHPDRYLSGELRDNAAEWNADIVYMTRDYFNHDNRCLLYTSIIVDRTFLAANLHILHIRRFLHPFLGKEIISCRLLISANTYHGTSGRLHRV